MKAAMIVAAKTFTTARMVKEYVERYYVPAMSGFEKGDDPPADDPTIRAAERESVTPA